MLLQRLALVQTCGDTRMPSVQTQQRLDFIDGLRFIATGSVLVQHLFDRTDASVIFHYFSPGIFGVVLFFFVSGFIIPHSVRKGFDSDAFVINRIFRIFPAYLVVLAVLLLLGASGIAPWSDQIQNVGAGGLLANILLVPEYVGAPQLLGVTWTLPIEFAWYGLCALIFAMGGSRWAFAASLAYSLAVIILALASFGFGIRAPLGRVSLINAALLGYVYYLWFTGVASSRQLNLATFSFAVSLAIALWIAFGHFAHPTTGAHDALLAWSAALAVFAAVVALPSVRGSRLLTRGVSRTSGRISYSIYLSHPIFIDLLLPTNNLFVLAVGASSLTIVFSVLMYKWVEQPGVSVGHALVGWLQRRNIAVLSSSRSGRSREFHLEVTQRADGTLHKGEPTAHEGPANHRRGE